MLSELKYLFFRTKKVFPVAYQEALLTANDTIPISKFSSRIASRLRLAGQKAHVVKANIIQIDDFAAILCTRNEIDSERSGFLPFLAEHRLQIGYIVKVIDFPIWGCVLVSKTDWQKYPPTATEQQPSPLAVVAD